MAEIPDIADPFDLFSQWFEHAKETLGEEIATSFTLATSSADGYPAARIVLLKGIGPEGYTFYTNLGSDKARDLKRNPRAAMCFHWQPDGTQVRIQGQVEQVPDAEADAYFAARPRESQLGAWASRQSEPLDSLNTLMTRVGKFAEQFGAEDIPRPEFWSGFRLTPDRYEFWLRGDFRLHDRRLYLPNVDGKWDQTRVYP